MTTMMRSGRACLVAIGRGLIRPLVRPFLRRDLKRALRARTGPFLILQQRELPIQQQAAAVQTVVSALALVQSHAPALYEQIRRDMTTIYLSTVDRAHYLVDLQACVLPFQQVLGENPATIAFTLVHEATHARIAHAGIGWWPRVEGRIERACLRRERRLASCLEVAGFDVGGMMDWLQRTSVRLEARYGPTRRPAHPARRLESGNVSGQAGPTNHHRSKAGDR